MLTAVCCTLGRKSLVEQAIRMFELQSYPDRHLFIYDTSGRLGSIFGHRWEIRSEYKWYDSFAACRNDAVRLSGGDRIVAWDDDDWYLPWHLAAHAIALEGGQWSAPSVVYDQWKPDEMIVTETFADQWPRDICYHGAWGFRLSALDAVGGYPVSGPFDNDTALRDRLLKVFGPPLDTICSTFPEPSYLYSRSRSGEMHGSETPPEITLAKRREKLPPFGTPLIPAWPKNFMRGLPEASTPCKRKW